MFEKLTNSIHSKGWLLHGGLQQHSQNVLLCLFWLFWPTMRNICLFWPCYAIQPGLLEWLKSGEFLEIHTTRRNSSRIVGTFNIFRPTWTLDTSHSRFGMCEHSLPWREATQDLLHLSGHCIIRVITMLYESEDVVFRNWEFGSCIRVSFNI